MGLQQNSGPSRDGEEFRIALGRGGIPDRLGTGRNSGSPLDIAFLGPHLDAPESWWEFVKAIHFRTRHLGVRKLVVTLFLAPEIAVLVRNHTFGSGIYVLASELTVWVRNFQFGYGIFIAYDVLLVTSTYDFRLP